MIWTKKMYQRRCDIDLDLGKKGDAILARERSIASNHTSVGTIQLLYRTRRSMISVGDWMLTRWKDTKNDALEALKQRMERKQIPSDATHKIAEDKIARADKK